MVAADGFRNKRQPSKRRRRRMPSRAERRRSSRSSGMTRVSHTIHSSTLRGVTVEDASGADLIQPFESLVRVSSGVQSTNRKNARRRFAWSVGHRYNSACKSVRGNRL